MGWWSRILIAASLALVPITNGVAKPPSSASPKTPSASGAPTAPVVVGAESLPAEELRLDTGVFRAALQKRGLVDVLELHLRDFPPSSAIARLLMTRDVRLAEFADADRPIGQRRASIAEANRVLEQLIAEAPDDPRQFTWRFTLAHSLLYDEAEPLLAPLIYHEKSLRDADGLVVLGGITTRALSAASQLAHDLSAELQSIDKLSVEEFEKLNASGRVREMEQMSPQAEYLRLWTLFYDAAWRAADDPARTRCLAELLQFLKDNPVYLETPHDRSRVQVQSLLLAGMARRRSDDLSSARELFDRALAAATRVADVAERERIQWAITLASLERARCARDDGRFGDALTALVQLRDQAVAGDAGFPLRFLAALTERSIARARAEVAAAQSNRGDEAQRFREEAWRTMLKLFEAEPARRDDLFLAVFDLNHGSTDPAKLDPFEQCAAAVGLLSSLETSSRTDDLPAVQAVRLAEAFLTTHGKDGGVLVPEMRYCLATARYRAGELAVAAKSFLELAKDFPTFARAEQASSFAVQLSADVDSRRLRVDAMSLLYERYPDSPTARAWRFQFATMLEEEGDFARAADQFSRLDDGDENYAEACFGRIRALSRAIRRDVEAGTFSRTDLNRRVDELRRALDPLVAAAANPGDAPERRSAAPALVVRARVILAEVDTLSGIEQFARALETVETFESAAGSPDSRALAGRVWRVRLLAYERLGRLDAAGDAIPAYLASDPAGAIETLHGLYETLANDADGGLEGGDADRAKSKAQTALLIAQQLYDHAEREPADATAPDRPALTLQLAEAHLRADHPERARELFRELLAGPNVTDAVQPTEPSSAPDPATKISPAPMTLNEPADLRARAGLAEAHFRLGAFDDALPLFNSLALRLPRKEPLRWRYLLRDLQCRTARNDPPGDIIKVIQQQKILQPDLGGPTLTAEFEKLLRENERHTSGK